MNIGGRRNRKGNLWVPGKKSYEWLLKYDFVKNFIAEYPNQKTKRDFLYALNKFFSITDVKPDGFIALDTKAAKQKILDVINPLKERDQSSYAMQIRATATDLWNTTNEYEKTLITFKRIRDKIAKSRKKSIIEHIPSKEEIYRMVDFWSDRHKKKPNLKALRNRAMILSQFESGVRAGALCNFTVGMVRKHLFPEIKTPIPLKITQAIDHKLSLYSLDYYIAFIWTEECSRYLRELIQFRERKGGLKDSDYLFTPYRSEAVYEKIGREAYNRQVVKYTAGQVGMDPKTVWSHLIRKSFNKVLNSARMPQDGDGKILDENTKEAVMGHRLPGSRENYFDRHDLSEIVKKMENCDFSRVTEADRIAEQKIKGLLAERDEEIERLRHQVERGPELDQLIKNKDDVIKLAKALEEYGFKIEKRK